MATATIAALVGCSGLLVIVIGYVFGWSDFLSTAALPIAISLFIVFGVVGFTSFQLSRKQPDSLELTELHASFRYATGRVVEFSWDPTAFQVSLAFPMAPNGSPRDSVLSTARYGKIGMPHVAGYELLENARAVDPRIVKPVKSYGQPAGTKTYLVRLRSRAIPTHVPYRRQ